jgi:hypothetical protein
MLYSEIMVNPKEAGKVLSFKTVASFWNSNSVKLCIIKHSSDPERVKIKPLSSLLNRFEPWTYRATSIPAEQSNPPVDPSPRKYGGVMVWDVEMISG